jgi:hypothetical protein
MLVLYGIGWSQYFGSGLDANSIGPVDLDSVSGSGSRVPKLPKKVKKIHVLKSSGGVEAFPGAWKSFVLV